MTVITSIESITGEDVIHLSRLGGQSYPMLTGNWKIVTTAIGDEEAVRNLPRQGDFLRLVRQNRVVDIYPEAPLPLEMSMAKGGFVLSKRLSRVMRPYFFWDFFTNVNIRYDATLNQKTWDGAGLISYRFLKRLLRHLPVENKAALRKRLLKTGRVEFTVLSERGEDKGHALVVRDLDADLVLPCDTKSELKLTDGRTFVGVQPVSGGKPLWIDVQSMINLYPFIDNKHYLRWIRQYGQVHLKRIEQDGFDNAFNGIKGSWWIAEYLNSGGKAMWFGGIVHALAGLFSYKVQQRSLKKYKFPAPGGRYYVFVDTVGKREIPKGQIDLDKHNATAWVSHHDWKQLAAIWGGADQDDSLLCLPFHDYDGDLKVLAWRNPNQPGEYAILYPTDATAALFNEWPELDSRLLPERIDFRQHTYVYDLEPQAVIDVPYSVRAMMPSIRAAQRNLGMPGMYINLLMVLQATQGTLPTELPASTESVMDAVAKTGTDTTLVKHWLDEYATQHFTAHPQVPQGLIPRVEKRLPEDLRDIFQPTEDHWFNQLLEGIRIELEYFETCQKTLAARTMPPIQVFQYGSGYTKQAASVKAAYAAVFRNLNHDPETEDFKRAWQATQRVLCQYPESEWGQILAAVVTRAYLFGEEPTSEGLIWQKELIPHTLAMLRAAGVLVEPDFCAVEEFRASIATGVPIRVNGAWFAYERAFCEQQQRALPEKMGDVSKGERDRVKGMVQSWAQQGLFDGQTFTVQKQDDRKIILKNGRLLGYLQRGHEDRVQDNFTGLYATSEDGNLLLVVGEI